MMDTLIGQIIKGYELHELLGMGGFGAVYRAHQPSIGRDVAIKVILPEYANHPEFMDRFEKEARFIARLEHPHIVPLYDYWQDANGTFLVMRMLSSSLRARLNKTALLPEEVDNYLDQIVAALSVAHENGVIHRDLKPDNILLDRSGNIYLGDFGIAKDLHNTGHTQAGSLIGSPEYFSPEQIQGKPITPQTDIYSLGVVLYELLTGHTPFASNGSIAELLYKHVHVDLPFLCDSKPDLPPELDEVIQIATRKDPAKRYPDVLSLAKDFRKALHPRFSNIADTSPGDALISISVNIQQPRQQEEAYLQSIIKENSRWAKLYTDLSGQVKVIPTETPSLVQDADAADELEHLMQQVEMAFAEHIYRGFSQSDDADKIVLKTFDTLWMAVRQYPRVALIGDPGCGKTTTLKRIALSAASHKSCSFTPSIRMPMVEPVQGRL